MSEENRSNAAWLTLALMGTVAVLVTFASQPRFTDSALRFIDVPTALLGLLALTGWLAYLYQSRAIGNLSRSQEASSEAIELANAQLSAVVGAFPDYIFRCTSDGRYIDVLGGTHSHISRPPYVFSGRRFEDILAPDNAQRLKEDVASVCDTGRLVQFEFVRAHPTTKQPRYMEVRLVRVNASEAISLVRDITDQKETQEALREARDRAEKLHQAKSRFLTLLSHEIRTPLNGIMGMADHLARTVHTPREKRFLEGMCASSRWLQQIVEGVLRESQLVISQPEVKKDLVDVRRIIDDVLTILSPRAFAQQVELAVFLDDDVPRLIHSDEGRLAQLLLNLVINAINATRNGLVLVRLARDHDGIRFRIIDTGTGLTAEQQQTLFAQFSRREAVEATANGHAVCHELARALNAPIGFRSRPGRGSTFWFTLPMQEVAQTAVSIPNLKGAVFFVVSRFAATRLAGVRILEAMQAQVQAFSDLDSARLAAVGRNFPLGVLVDERSFPALTPRLEVLKSLQCDIVPRGFVFVMTSPMNATMQSMFADSVGFFEVLRPLSELRFAQLIDDILSRPVESRRHTRLSKAPLAPPLRALELRKMVAERGRILVVDDNAVNRELVRTLLEEINIPCDCACDGVEAVAAIQGTHYGLVLMDIQMPRLDGLEATMRIRARPADGFQQPVIVAMSARTSQGDQQRFRAAGMESFIEKPILLESLMELLEKWWLTGCEACNSRPEATQ